MINLFHPNDLNFKLYKNNLIKRKVIFTFQNSENEINFKTSVSYI